MVCFLSGTVQALTTGARADLFAIYGAHVDGDGEEDGGAERNGEEGEGVGPGEAGGAV